MASSRPAAATKSSSLTESYRSNTDRVSTLSSASRPAGSSWYSHRPQSRYDHAMPNCKHGIDVRFCAACANPLTRRDRYRSTVKQRAQLRAPANDVEREAFEAVYAYEEALSVKNGNTNHCVADVADDREARPHRRCRRDRDASLRNSRLPCAGRNGLGGDGVRSGGHPPSTSVLARGGRAIATPTPEVAIRRFSAIDFAQKRRADSTARIRRLPSRLGIR